MIRQACPECQYGTLTARPGGNVTGSSFLSPELNAKRLEVLKEAFRA